MGKWRSMTHVNGLFCVGWLLMCHWLTQFFFLKADDYWENHFTRNPKLTSAHKEHYAFYGLVYNAHSNPWGFKPLYSFPLKCMKARKIEKFDHKNILTDTNYFQLRIGSICTREHTHLDCRAEPAAFFRRQTALWLITSCPCEDARVGGPHSGTPTKRLLPHATAAIATKTLQRNLGARLVQIDAELHNKLNLGMVGKFLILIAKFTN